VPPLQHLQVLWLTNTAAHRNFFLSFQIFMEKKKYIYIYVWNLYVHSDRYTLGIIRLWLRNMIIRDLCILIIYRYTLVKYNINLWLRLNKPLLYQIIIWKFRYSYLIENLQCQILYNICRYLHRYVIYDKLDFHTV